MTEDFHLITSFQGVPFAGNSFLDENELKTASNNSLYFPTEGGTVLTDRTIGDHTPKELEDEYNQLINYLRHWARAGNFNMDDLDDYLATGRRTGADFDKRIAELEEQIAALTEERQLITQQILDLDADHSEDVNGDRAAEKLALINRSNELITQIADLNTQLETLRAQTVKTGWTDNTTN